MTQRCGYLRLCPVYFSAHEVNVSAAEWDPSNATHRWLLSEQHNTARSACTRSGGKFLQTGGWCLGRSKNRVFLPRNESYGLPQHHKQSDGIIVATLAALLVRARQHRLRRRRHPAKHLHATVAGARARLAA